MDFKLAPRDQIILAVVVAVLILLGFGILVVRPQFSRIAELRAQQQEELKKKQNAVATLQRLQEAKKEAAETESKLIEIGSTKVPDSKLAYYHSNKDY